jgi:MFS family permease
MTDERTDYPPATRAWAMVGVFFLISAASVLDRGVLGLFVDQVRHDLSITDIQIGILQGFAFSLLYSLMGLPMGLITDRANRRNLIIAGVMIWSAATIMGGLAASFDHLFVARLLVGLGEAALGPAVISTIADMFPPERRARPISVFLMGQSLAGGLSLSITGWMLAFVVGRHFGFLPAALQSHPWRMVFILCGLVGFVLAPLLLFFREPARHQSAGVANIRIAEIGTHVWRERRILVPLYLAFAVSAASLYGAGAWLPAMLHRTYGMTGQSIGAALGLAAMIAGVSGALLGGQLAQWVTRRGIRGGKLWLAALACLVAMISAFAGFAMHGEHAIEIAVILNACFPIVGVCVTSTATEVVPPRMRGIAISAMGLFNGLIGATLGPYLIAFFTEKVFADPAKLYLSMASVSAPAMLIAAVIFVIAGWQIRRASRHTVAARAAVVALVR